MVGEVIKRQFSGSVDAAFVKMTTSAIVPSRYTRYVNSSGGKGDTYMMCASCAYGSVPSIGQTVYKSGHTTYLTSSQVASTNYTVNYANEGVTLTNMIKTTTCFSDHGDSGSNVFTKEHGNVYETVGVISGGDGATCSIFTNMALTDQKWVNSQGMPLSQY